MAVRSKKDRTERSVRELVEAIVADAAKRFRPRCDTIEHGRLLYDEETGLPK